MSFDALTIGGLLAAVLSGGFLVGVVSYNDRRSDTSACDESPEVPAPLQRHT